MAVTNVTYTLNGKTESMPNVSGNRYEIKTTAPEEYGTYLVSITAYDDAGNVSMLNTMLMATDWITPKTNWRPTDRFNIEDFNRIRGNLLHLYNRAIRLFSAFEIEDMGEALDTYEAYWKVEYFNAFEANVDLINQHITTRDYGTRKIFYENGIFIDWEELNRIESACLAMKKIVDDQAEIIRNLPFRLGTYKEVRI